MSKRKRSYSRRKDPRHIWVFSERRDPPDISKLSSALLQRAMELAQAEADAQADAANRAPRAGGRGV